MSGAIRRPALLLGVIGLLVLAGVGFTMMLTGSDPAAAPQIDPNAVDLSALDRVPTAIWDKLAQKRVFFGHQSVGADIMDGVGAITKRKPHIKLRIIESADAMALTQPGFAHAKVGTNENVDSKLKDFKGFLTGPLGEQADIALLKFCYVDIFDPAGADTILDKYKRTVGELKAARPNLELVHLTMPVTTVEAGTKAKIKKLLGRKLSGYAYNEIRNNYNSRIRSEFGTRDGVIFDVAKSESVLPDGRRAIFESGGRENECLSKGYTTDGGHLNEAGKLAAARDLLLVLADQCK
jgi:hypothetical protein